MQVGSIEIIESFPYQKRQWMKKLLKASLKVISFANFGRVSAHLGLAVP